MAKGKVDRRTVDAVLVLLGSVATAVLLAVGVVAWWGGQFAKQNVRNELSAQKIYFPAELDPNEYPDLQEYAGQQVDDGIKAKAYANGYIARHLEDIAGGKTYSEVSAELRKDPNNQTLKNQKDLLFQGETLRGLLLGDGYAFWTFGELAHAASWISLAGASVMAVLVIMGLFHMRFTK
jgi:hypothetical protein